MSTPVVANEWAGNHECSGPCRRKRLLAESFSKKAMERHLKHGAPLKCKQCIEQAQSDERAAAAAALRRPAPHTASAAAEEQHRVCASCQSSLPESAYNKNQWRNKAEGKSKCRTCVDQALKQEQASQEKALQEAQAAVEAATTPQQLQAESRLSALQAQRVTGLKPIRMSATATGRGGPGRARGRGRGGSSARGGRGRSSARS